MGGLFLGLDSSTQSLSACLIDTRSGVIVWEHSLRFGEDQNGHFVTFRDEALSSPDQQLVGWADDLLITTKALTAEQIAQLSNRRNN